MFYPVNSCYSGAPPFTSRHEAVPRFNPSEHPAPTPVSIPSCSQWQENITPLKPARLYDYLSPTQAVSLFVGGLATSVALNWFTKGLLAKKKLTLDPFKAMAKNSEERQKQITTILDEGLPAVVLMAFENPHLQNGLKAYAGASVLGYVLGSLLQGIQEVWVRREETQVRADLIRQMSHAYSQSMQIKSVMDNQLKEGAKKRILEVLTRYRVPNPQRLIGPEGHHQIDIQAHQRYPFELSHFTIPISDTPVGYRFGQKPCCKNSAELNSPWFQTLAKGGVFALGAITGLLGQGILGMLRHGSSSSSSTVGQTTKRISYEIFNVRNWEALFLAGNGKLLMGLLGLAAAAKLGKSLVDGYREIEVTRNNAETELRYQVYNWRVLDPSFHKIAESVALDNAIRQLEEAIPYEFNNRQALRKRVDAILSNIGRNSAPKYFQMTPPVSLVAARG